MSDWLAAVSASLSGAPVWSVGAAALLGAASVVVSPCHLAGVPLVVGVVQTQRAPGRSPRGVALRFGAGVLLSFALVGGLTLAAGRIAGDIGRLGNLLGAAVFLAFGLQLLEAIEIPWFGSLTAHARGRAAGPVLVGLLFGASLGPCTFSFMAPALGAAVAVSQEHPLQAAGMLLAFAVAHAAVVTAAGVFGDVTERFLDSRGAARAVSLFRKGTGVVLILAGLYTLYTMR